MRPRRSRRLALATTAVLAATVLAGCSGGQDADTGGGKGFVTSDGQLTLIDRADRPRVGRVAGDSLEGTPISLAGSRGKVTVVNVWGSWCTPCREEAPELVSAYDQLGAGRAGSDVAFLGINTRDPGPAAALSFQRTFDVPYPSVFDQGGSTLLEFGRPLVIPSTVVVDRQGRVAAVVLGKLPSTRTLVDVVEDLVQEPHSRASDTGGSGA